MGTRADANTLIANANLSKALATGSNADAKTTIACAKGSNADAKTFFASAIMMFAVAKPAENEGISLKPPVGEKIGPWAAFVQPPPAKWFT
jgi:hypothetical protein